MNMQSFEAVVDEGNVRIVFAKSRAGEWGVFVPTVGVVFTLGTSGHWYQ
jgi:hypothetical protein